MSRNPSEMQRELWEEHEELHQKIVSGKYIKADKEILLRRLRQLENELDIRPHDYNSSGFKVRRPRPM